MTIIKRIILSIQSWLVSLRSLSSKDTRVQHFKRGLVVFGVLFLIVGVLSNILGDNTKLNHFTNTTVTIQQSTTQNNHDNAHKHTYTETTAQKNIPPRDENVHDTNSTNMAHEQNVEKKDIPKKDFVFSGNPVIAIGLYDFGLSNNLSKKAMDTLPQTITPILSPYAQEWIDILTQNQQEYWLELPIETKTFPRNDQGYLSLLTTNSLKQNMDTLKLIIDIAQEYKGLAVYSDTAFEKNPTVFEDITEYITEKKISLYEMNPDGYNTIKRIADKNDTPYIRNTVDFNHSNFKMLERQALENGTAITSIRLTPKALKDLQNWVKTLPDKNIDIAPLSALSQLKNANL